MDASGKTRGQIISKSKETYNKSENFTGALFLTMQSHTVYGSLSQKLNIYWQHQMRAYIF